MYEVRLVGRLFVWAIIKLMTSPAITFENEHERVRNEAEMAANVEIRNPLNDRYTIEQNTVTFEQALEDIEQGIVKAIDELGTPLTYDYLEKLLDENRYEVTYFIPKLERQEIRTAEEAVALYTNWLLQENIKIERSGSNANIAQYSARRAVATTMVLDRLRETASEDEYYQAGAQILLVSNMLWVIESNIKNDKNPYQHNMTGYPTHMSRFLRNISDIMLEKTDDGQDYKIEFKELWDNLKTLVPKTPDYESNFRKLRSGAFAEFQVLRFFDASPDFEIITGNNETEVHDDVYNGIDGRVRILGSGLEFAVDIKSSNYNTVVGISSEFNGDTDASVSIQVYRNGFMTNDANATIESCEISPNLVKYVKSTGVPAVCIRVDARPDWEEISNLIVTTANQLK